MAVKLFARAATGSDGGEGEGAKQTWQTVLLRWIELLTALAALVPVVDAAIKIGHLLRDLGIIAGCLALIGLIEFARTVVPGRRRTIALTVIAVAVVTAAVSTLVWGARPTSPVADPAVPTPGTAPSTMPTNASLSPMPSPTSGGSNTSPPSPTTDNSGNSVPQPGPLPVTTHTSPKPPPTTHAVVGSCTYTKNPIGPGSSVTLHARGHIDVYDPQSVYYMPRESLTSCGGMIQFTVSPSHDDQIYLSGAVITSKPATTPGECAGESFNGFVTPSDQDEFLCGQVGSVRGYDVALQISGTSNLDSPSDPSVTLTILGVFDR